MDRQAVAYEVISIVDMLLVKSHMIGQVIIIVIVCVGTVYDLGCLHFYIACRRNDRDRRRRRGHTTLSLWNWDRLLSLV